MNCKPGDLVILVDTHPDFSYLRGRIGTIKQPCAAHSEHWDLDPPLMFAGMEVSAADRHLRPIRDNPGNESWFTAAPRSKPAPTKQDTIDARGMVRS